VLIVDYQDEFTPRGARLRAADTLDSLGARVDAQRESKGRASAWDTEAVEPPTVVVDDGVSGRQPEPGTAPYLFGREKGLEHASAHVLGNTRPVVSHFLYERILFR
jgi:hypothetical protein